MIVCGDGPPMVTSYVRSGFCGPPPSKARLNVTTGLHSHPHHPGAFKSLHKPPDADYSPGSCLGTPARLFRGLPNR